jgi:hypothetical protein
MELVVDVVEVVVLDIMEAQLVVQQHRREETQVAHLQTVAQMQQVLQVEEEWGLQEWHQQQEVMVVMEGPMLLEVFLTHLPAVVVLEVEQAQPRLV